MSVLSQPFVRRKKPQPEKFEQPRRKQQARHVSLSKLLHAPQMATHALFETASGYAVFKVNFKEDIGALSKAVQDSTDDLAKFGKMVSLVSFSPFKSAAHALENANDVSEGQSRFFWCFSVASWLVLGVCVYQPLRISCSRTGRMIEDPMSLARVADMYFPFGQAS
jgi:hypothetical protein